MTKTDPDDILLRQFLKENKKEIEDFGFSRKVIHRLPYKEKTLLRWWTAVCAALCTGLFFTFGGLNYLIQLIYEVFIVSFGRELTEMNPLHLILAFLVIAGIEIQRICTIE